MTVPKSRLKLALGLSTFAPLFVADETYAALQSDSVKELWRSWHQNERLGYTKRHDCDDFARSFAQYCSDAHAATNSRAPETRAEGLAVFEFWYTKADGQPHAINLCLTSDAGRRFLEPQTGEWLDLDANRILTCAFVR